MTTLAIGFRSLKHPLSLFSIGLLLFNDHVLKAAAPSPLTGKLSDLAGLFFFPFLLAVFLSLFLTLLHPGRQPSPRGVAALAFGLTALWFTLIKTWPWANLLTETALARLLDSPVQIVRDPTDLLALVVLWPAWRLWGRLEQTCSQRRPGKAAYLALGLATLATLATSPCEETPVTRLTVSENSIYADFDYPPLGRSDDGGRTWVQVRQPAELLKEIGSQLKHRGQLPLTVCDPENSQTCYRITGAEQVEGSQDGGQTWHVVWQVPRGRRKFMERFIATQSWFCTKELNLAPKDLALLSHNGGTTLVAAMGEEGVLVRDPTGDWQRYEVFAAYPTPYSTTDFWALFWLLLYENTLLVIATVTSWALCIWGWHIISSKAQLPSEYSAGWAVQPALGGMGLLLLSFVVAFIVWPPLVLLSVILTTVLAFVGPLLIWRRMASVSPRPEMVRRVARASVMGAAGIFPLAWLPFPLWGAGVIPLYEVSLALSILVGVSTLIWSVHRVRQASRAATTPAEGNGVQSITS